MKNLRVVGFYIRFKKINGGEQDSQVYGSQEAWAKAMRDLAVLDAGVVLDDGYMLSDSAYAEEDLVAHYEDDVQVMGDVTQIFDKTKIEARREMRNRSIQEPTYEMRRQLYD